MVATLVIGILTGLVSGTLFLSAATGSVVGVFVLLLLSPLPVAIAGLGWSARAATVAVGAAALLVAIVARDKVQGPLVYVVAYGGPAALLAHLALLARAPDEAGSSGAAPSAATLEWYPLGRILAAIGMWAGVLTAISMLVMLSDRPATMKMMRSVVTTLEQRGYAIDGKPGPSSPEQIERFVEFMLSVIPFFIAFFWVAVVTLNIWLAGQTVRAAGRLKRPWPDIAATVLPIWLALLLAGSLLVSFAGGTIATIAIAIAAGCLAAYTFGGLAILHHITRGLTGRPLLLGGVYVAMVVISPIAIPAIALIALAEPILSVSRRGADP